MREIKFRCYDTLNERWQYFNMLDALGYETPFCGFEIDEKTLGQFTGLKDKNGVDIYEGDRLKITDLDNYCEVITWETNVRFSAGCFAVDVENQPYTSISIGFLDEEYIFEVIGNIHETEDKTI